MKKAIGLALLAAALIAAAPRTGLYHVQKIWRLGGAGGWDYVTADAAAGLVYVTRSTHTMVLNAADGRQVADILGQERSHGVALAPAAGRGFISDGKAGAVVVFDLKTRAVLGQVKAAPDADGIIYDAADNRVLVAAGDAQELVSIPPDVDLKTGKGVRRLDLGGKPEFLAADGRGRAYVNLVNKDEVAVVDVRAMKVLARWPTAPGGVPTGLAIDAARGLLFVGCRKPAKLVVMSAKDGRVLSAVDIGQGVDAVRAAGGAAFASCGDGTLTEIRETAPGKFAAVQILRTEKGARTMGLDPLTHKIYLPTALFGGKKNARGRPIPEPGTFRVVVVGL
ncbi:MAG TPA: YncE family protein [Elusimicrobiota bacterium]|nr:YncE family protein [Elusimicrobiota bacterium]